MEYWTAEGPAVLVGSADAGHRTQGFATRAFREQLGRGDGSQQHTSARLGARQRAFRVNGALADGRQVLCAGDVVSLDLAGPCVAEAAGAGPGGRRKRMVYDPGGDEEVGDRGNMPSPTSPAARAWALYYGQQLQQLLGQEEWRRVQDLFQQPLPLSVRLNRSSLGHEASLAELRELLSERLQPLPWHPGAWQLLLPGDDREGASVDPTEMTAKTLEVTEMLLQAQSGGELALQEAVAMLPALALSPSAGDLVLELCAAPGGKTLQLLDAALLAESSLLISNDLESKRQERTWRRAQCQRCDRLVVTSCDATSFPGLQEASTGAPLLFDRVLADVPCNGDGTLRKSPEKLGKWNVRAGLRTHRIQLGILRRGLELLKPGGRLVYSTCSLDPLEGEAVVAAALQQDETVSLVEPSYGLPELAALHLRYSGGLRTWQVPHPQFEVNQRLYSRLEEVPEELLGEDLSEERLLSTMFPPAGVDLHLHRCIRLLPTHGIGFGGFFVAILERRPACELTTPVEHPAGEAPSLLPHGPVPFVRPCPAAEQLELQAFFGLPPDFCSRLAICAVGAGDTPLLLSLVPAMLLDLQLMTSEPEAAGLRTLGCGLPMLCCMRGVPWWPRMARWRICQEGAVVLAGSAARRVLRVPGVGASLELLERRRVGLWRLLDLATVDLSGCCGAEGEIEAGAVLVVLPAELLPTAPHAPRPLGPVFSGVLLLTDGAEAAGAELLLLAQGDLLTQASRRLRAMEQRDHC